MTLADKLAKSPAPAYPHYLYDTEMSSYTLGALAANKFGNFREAKIQSNFTVYAGGPGFNEAETEQYIKNEFSAILFEDKNNNRHYDAEYDKKIADLRLFISHDGKYLEEMHKKTIVRDDEMAIFLEMPDGDVFSNQVLYVKAGKNTVQYVLGVLKTEWVSEKFALSKVQVLKLLGSMSTGKYLLEEIVAMVMRAPGYLIDKAGENLVVPAAKLLAEFLEKNVRLSEMAWNSEAEGYVFGKSEDKVIAFFNDMAQSLEQFIKDNKKIPDGVKNIIAFAQKIFTGLLDFIEENKQVLEGIWAYMCGLINGVIDLIVGIVNLVELLFERRQGTPNLPQRRSLLQPHLQGEHRQHDPLHRQTRLGRNHQ
ncbi:hypothetical protein [Flavobacterium sp.]|uniref:hypothetical protein n=1 Tax=Flavobacterium sp. TaxID=239 RepID=UPI0039E56AF9